MSNKDSNNHLKSEAVSQKTIDEFDLSRYLVNFLWHEPFYSRILRSLNKIETESIPTAGVSTQDGEITLWWNRKFMSGLSNSEVYGLLKHECLHLVFGHTTERRKDPHIIWNYGTDCAINSTIPESELPKGGLIPGKELYIDDDTKNQMNKAQLEAFTKLSDKIKSFPKDKTSEYYFEKLNEDEEVKKAIEDLNECCNESGIQPVGFDDHNGWDELDDSEKELIAGKIKEIVKEAASECQSRGWGSVSASLRKEINKMLSNEIKWESLLKRFCGFTKKNERTSSVRKLNRKYPGIHSGIQKNYKPMIAVYIDESGSVSDGELEKFYSELDNLSTKTDFYVYKFDTEVDEKSSFVWKKRSKPKIVRNLVGGTCFNSVTRHALKNKRLFDGYIILTDGGAAKPQPSVGLRRCWILAEKCNLPFSKDKNDIAINIK